MNTLIISDIHFGHPKTPTSFIVSNFHTFFEENHELFAELDVLFIAGDITDRLIKIWDPVWKDIFRWYQWLMKYCEDHGIILRILEGTKSHDRGQASIAEGFERSDKIDFRYIDTMTIETLEGLDVLYVPDDMCLGAEELKKEVQATLKSFKKTKVDICVLHGLFNYQLPMVNDLSFFDEDYMSSITRLFISIGHVHSFSERGKIIAQGSFDRLAHNEEEEKGAVYVDTDTMEWKRVINKNAMTYHTVDVSNMGSHKDLRKIVKGLREGSKIRLEGPATNALIQNVKELPELYPAMEWSVKKEKEDKVVNIRPVTITTKAIVLNEATLSREYESHLKDLGYEEEVITDQLKVLEELLLN